MTMRLPFSTKKSCCEVFEGSTIRQVDNQCAGVVFEMSKLIRKKKFANLVMAVLNPHDDEASVYSQFFSKAGKDRACMLKKESLLRTKFYSLFQVKRCLSYMPKWKGGKPHRVHTGLAKDRLT
jgi:hypothetical protein